MSELGDLAVVKRLRTTGVWDTSEPKRPFVRLARANGEAILESLGSSDPTTGEVILVIPSADRLGYELELRSDAETARRLANALSNLARRAGSTGSGDDQD